MMEMVMQRQMTVHNSSASAPAKKSEITNLVATLYKAGMTAWQTSDLADCNRQNMFVNWNSYFISTFFSEYIK